MTEYKIVIQNNNDIKNISIFGDNLSVFKIGQEVEKLYPGYLFIANQ